MAERRVRPPAFYQAVPGQLKWAQPHKRMASSVLSAIKNQKPDLIHAHFAMPSGGAALCQRL